MWEWFNPNPLGLDVGDCTVRAICAVTGLEWYDVHDQLCLLSRARGDMPNADRVWWELIERYGFEYRGLVNECPRCFTVRDFAREHPEGVFILGPWAHAVAVINGSYYDNWDSGDTVPEYYFERRYTDV